MRIFIIMLALVLLSAGTMEAKNTQLISKEQFDSSTRIWLARAMIGESGWLSVNDHVAIAYVLKRRWNAIQNRWPKIRFKTVILAYAKALGGGRREYTRRQIWVRSLSFDLSEPQGWPQKVSWKSHSKYWIQTLERVDRWVRGELPDPCKGRAFHWGGNMDTPRETMFPVDCGDTINTFYGLKSIIKQGDDDVRNH